MNQQLSGWKKYRSIIFSIIFLLLVTLSILGTSYYNDRLYSNNSVQINLAARLTAVTKEIKNNIFNIDIYAKQLLLGQGTLTPRQKSQLLLDIQTQAQKLEQSAQEFSQITQLFAQGGPAPDFPDEHIIPFETRQNIELLKAIQGIWKPYDRLINNFDDGLKNQNLNIAAINYASDYARIFNDRLSALSEKIMDNLAQHTRKQSFIARIVLISAFILALLITAYLIFVAFRQLLRSDHALAKSQKELHDIMDTITEGLFLIDEKLEIGEQHSKELEKIFNNQDFSHLSLTDILRDKISAKEMDITQGFLEQLFRKDIFDDLIEALNPLDRIHIVSDNPFEEENRDKYLSFNFRRVFEGQEINHILVSVKDITENVLLERKLEQERQESEAKMDMLSGILQVDDDLMADFLHHVDQGCHTVNTILETSNGRSGALREQLKQISRVIHSIKGEASALSMSEFTHLIEKFEADIAKVNKKPTLNGNDFLGLAVHLDKLMTTYEKTNGLFQKLMSGKLRSSDVKHPGEGLAKLLKPFALQIAERNGGKKVQIECLGFEDQPLNPQQSEQIRELSLQLLRNAIVHGIETPEHRAAYGKEPMGKIEVQLEKMADNRHWLYSFKDDGQGINFDALRKLAAHHPRYHGRNPQTLNEKELLRLMFDSGISTAEKPNEDAGRGVGMDVIRAAVMALHGKINVQTESGQWTRFSIRFPIEEAQ